MHKEEEDFRSNQRAYCDWTVMWETFGLDMHMYSEGMTV